MCPRWGDQGEEELGSSAKCAMLRRGLLGKRQAATFPFRFAKVADGKSSVGEAGKRRHDV